MAIQQNNKLLDNVKRVMRLKHYSIHTERIYCDWIKQYVKFHKMSDRTELLVNPEVKVEDFLSYLAIQRKVAVSTQNQAMNALVFLYKRVLEKPLEKTVDAVRSTKNRKIPVVLTQEEVKDIITLLDGVSQLMIKLLYGSGLRITEAVRLRVQDVDFDYKQITVRSGKGNKDRVTTFSSSLMSQLKEHLQRVQLIHDKDLQDGYGCVYLQHALSKKYPNAEKEWGWQYVFPARNLSTDPRSGAKRRHHIHESSLQKAMKNAVRLAGIAQQLFFIYHRSWRNRPGYPGVSSDNRTLTDHCFSA